MPDRETIISLLLIVGIIAAILLGRQRGKARLAASIAAAVAQARVDFDAELSAFASAGANVQVTTTVGQVAGGERVALSEYEMAVLAVLRGDPRRLDAVQLGQLGRIAARDDGATFDYGPGDDGDAIYRAVGRGAGTRAGRTVPVDRFVGGHDREHPAFGVASDGRPVEPSIEQMCREPWLYDG